MSEVTEKMVRSAVGLQYWQLRYLRHREKTPGTSNKKMSEQELEYKQKFDFIIPKLDISNKYVLDYGCGIGRYAAYCDHQRYYGYDPVETAVEIAKKQLPEHTFSTKLPSKIKGCYDVAFLFTVLQHIEEPSKVIEKIDVPTIYVYENTSNNEDKPYIWFRTARQYVELFSRFGYICKDMCTHHVKTTNRKGTKRSEQHTFFSFEKRSKID